MKIIRPEDELLICCARTIIDEGTRNRMHTLLRQDIDWSYLLQLAVHHRVTPLLYRSLEQNCLSAPPEGTLLKLECYFRANTGRNLFLSGELIKLVDMLELHRISSIPYKGPALSALAYGNIGLREFGDLDILVPSCDYFKTRNFLLARGYRLTTDFGWECGLVHETRGVCIDLHRGITPDNYPVRIDFERLHERTKPVSIAGQKIDTLCPEDMLVFLCIQLAKDAWSEIPPFRLSKVCDIAELLRTHPGIAWGQVFEDAERLGVQRMLLLSLSVAHALLAAPVPEPMNRLQDAVDLDMLNTHVYQRLFHGPDGSCPMHLSMARFHFKVRERWQDKLYPYYHFLKVRIIPSDKDRALVSLPESLGFLYYIIRPMRLAKIHAPTLLKKLKAKYRDPTAR